MRARTPQQPARWIRTRRVGAAVVFGLIAALAACTNLDDLTEPDCAYTVSPAQIDVGNQGAAGTLAIRTPGACAWTVESSAGWVSLAGDGSGNGDANLAYTVAAHEGFDFRYATLTAGRPLPPPQAVCAYSVSPAAVASPQTGGPGSIAVAAPAGCGWSATSQAAWLTITSGASGSGSGAFGFQVAANNASASRTGSLSAAGQTITVTQAGTGPPQNCTFTVAPTSASFPATGGVGTITVTAPAGCAWTARSEDSWIVITTGASGSGNGLVTYTVAPRTSKGDRDGRLTVAGRRVDISQQGTG
jgi:hypothetical protein